jgi:excisionase family DNA binding protein
MNDLVTVTEFADHFHITEPTVYTAIKQQRITATKILGRVVIPRSELRRFKRRKNGNKSWILRKA